MSKNYDEFRAGMWGHAIEHEGKVYVPLTNLKFIDGKLHQLHGEQFAAVAKSNTIWLPVASETSE